KYTHDVQRCGCTPHRWLDDNAAVPMLQKNCRAFLGVITFPVTGVFRKRFTADNGRISSWAKHSIRRKCFGPNLAVIFSRIYTLPVMSIKRLDIDVVLRGQAGSFTI